MLLAPAVFFFSTARMIVRSRELRAVAQSMAQVALRLAEPESVARDSLVTVGQAIRREVSAMGDGVERALARAAELETLVQNEVSAIERAYNDNEVRIRGLLEDLARQRDSLIGQADQVREALSGAHPISTTTSTRSARSSPARSTKPRSASPAPSPRRARTSPTRSRASAIP